MTADIEMFKASEETLSGAGGKLFVRSWRASAKSRAILAIHHGSSMLCRSGRRHLIQAEADREPDFPVEILDTKVVEAMNGPGGSEGLQFGLCGGIGTHFIPPACSSGVHAWLNNGSRSWIGWVVWRRNP